MSSQLKKKLRLIFMGTPAFALPSLQALASHQDFELVAVFTQPDRPAGRGQALSFSPVKQLALELNLPIYQPLKLTDSSQLIADLKPDLIVVVAYGLIIPPDILAIPPQGCLNVHASLLPKYRGAACLSAPLLNGDQTTGVTIMLMDKGLDTGPILRQAEVPLSDHETTPSLHDKLSLLGAKLLPETILDWVQKKIEPQNQTNSLSSYVGMIKKRDGLIDWQKPALMIEREIRAYQGWPSSYSYYQGQLIKILAVDKKPINLNNYKAGQLFSHQQQLAVQTGSQALMITKLQLAGKRALTGQEFLRGYQLAILT
ncbi:MAG: methionyl-tRNA formyltransferase [Patescibacteria group bacterium]